jgi:hypothetical protein
MFVTTGCLTGGKTYDILTYGNAEVGIAVNLAVRATTRLTYKIDSGKYLSPKGIGHKPKKAYLERYNTLGRWQVQWVSKPIHPKP